VSQAIPAWEAQLRCKSDVSSGSGNVWVQADLFDPDSSHILPGLRDGPRRVDCDLSADHFFAYEDVLAAVYDAAAQSRDKYHNLLKVAGVDVTQLTELVDCLDSRSLGTLTKLMLATGIRGLDGPPDDQRPSFSIRESVVISLRA